jgi:hypothetical protein
MKTMKKGFQLSLGKFCVKSLAWILMLHFVINRSCGKRSLAWVRMFLFPFCFLCQKSCLDIDVIFCDKSFLWQKAKDWILMLYSVINRSCGKRQKTECFIFVSMARIEGYIKLLVNIKSITQKKHFNYHNSQVIQPPQFKLNVRKPSRNICLLSIDD